MSQFAHPSLVAVGMLSQVSLHETLLYILVYGVADFTWPRVNSKIFNAGFAVGDIHVMFAKSYINTVNSYPFSGIFGVP